MMNDLIKKINDKSAVIGIIGLGYVGLPLVIRFSEEQFKVIGFDIDTEKCRTLNSGESYIRHISAKSIQHAIENGFIATTNWEQISAVDCMLICVPTPLGINNSPDSKSVVTTGIKPSLPNFGARSVDSSTCLILFLSSKKFLSF